MTITQSFEEDRQCHIVTKWIQLHIQLNLVISTLICATLRLQLHTSCGTNQFPIRHVFSCLGQHDTHKSMYLRQNCIASYWFKYNFPRSRFFSLRRQSLNSFRQLYKFQAWKMTIVTVINFPLHFYSCSEQQTGNVITWLQSRIKGRF